MTIFGWDASDYDWDRGPMDIGAAARDGIVFFTHKFTEGSTWRAKHARDAMNRARAAGIPFLGGYHVVRSSSSSSAQVNNLLGFADSIVPWWRDFSGWFWQVDLEHWDNDLVSPAKGKEFTNALRVAQSKAVIMYASKGQYGDSLSGLNAELWNANYGNNPVGHYRALYPGDKSPRWAPYSGQVPEILQYGSQCRIGSQNTCDANAFRGTEKDFAAMIGAITNESAAEAVVTEEDMNGEVPEGVAFNADNSWLDQKKAVALPVPAVGNSDGQWGPRWVWLAGNQDSVVRVVWNGGGWSGRDVTLTPNGDSQLVDLPVGTNKIFIGYKSGAGARYLVKGEK